MRAASGVSAWAMRSMISSGIGDAQVVFHELGVAQAGERPDAGDDRNAERLDAVEEFLEQAKVEDWLRDGVFCARLDLVGKAAQFVFDIGYAGVGGDADGEVGRGGDGVGANVEPVIESAHDVDEADGVHVEHGGRVWVVAEFRRVTGQAEDIAAGRWMMRRADRTGC